MTIRTYDNQKDRETVVALWRDVFTYATGHNDPERSIDRKVAAGEDGLFLVAEREGAVVGTVMGGYDGHRGWIYSLAVAEPARRLGLGTALVREVERRLADHGCPKINLQVLPDNRDVIAFYERLGYAVEERISLGKKTGQP